MPFVCHPNGCCFLFTLLIKGAFFDSFVFRDPLPVVWLFFNSFHINRIIISLTGRDLQENISSPLTLLFWPHAELSTDS